MLYMTAIILLVLQMLLQENKLNFTNNFNSANNYATTGFGQEDTGGGGRIVCGISSPATTTDK